MKYNSLLEVLETFPDETACVQHLEQLRWPSGIICPLCGESGKIHRYKTRLIYKCGDCEKQFSVRKGTIFEESRLPLGKWFVAAWLITSNRKGIPSTQLAREIGVTQKTAWFMLHRLREVAGQINGTGSMTIPTLLPFAASPPRTTSPTSRPSRGLVQSCPSGGTPSPLKTSCAG